MQAKVRPKKYYKTRDGVEPAREYISSLAPAMKARVFMQIDKAKLGNFAHGHGVGGVSELVIDVGPGYRVYYAIVDGDAILLLLEAGDKQSQQDDIKQAKVYLKDYESRFRKVPKQKPKTSKQSKKSKQSKTSKPHGSKKNKI